MRYTVRKFFLHLGPQGVPFIRVSTRDTTINIYTLVLLFCISLGVSDVATRLISKHGSVLSLWCFMVSTESTQEHNIVQMSVGICLDNVGPTLLKYELKPSDI